MDASAVEFLTRCGQKVTASIAAGTSSTDKVKWTVSSTIANQGGMQEMGPIARIIILAGSASLVGCASLTPTIPESTLTPPERRLALQQKADDSASLFVIRDRAMAGGARDYELLIDGALAAKISAGEYVQLYLSPGERLLEVRPPQLLGLGVPGDGVTIRAEPAAEYFFRINSDGMSVRLLRTTKQSALGQQ
jgi:hypothetical protein